MTLDIQDAACAADQVLAAPPECNIVEVLRARDEVVGFSAVICDSSDAALGGESTQIVSASTLHERARAADEVLTLADMLVSERATAANEVLPFSLSLGLLEDYARTGDALLLSSGVDLNDGSFAADAALVSTSVDCHSSARAGEASDYYSMGHATLIDHASSADQPLTSTASVGLLDAVDAATAFDALILHDPRAVAWVLNPDTASVCWYDNWGFAAMAQAGDKVFAASANGLAVVAGGADDGANINAAVQWGFSEFGGYERDGTPKPLPQRKRVAALWFGYSAYAPLQATVQVHDSTTHRYTMQARDAMQPKNNRILVGKGLSARYWRIGVENLHGGDFKVYDVQVDALTTTRRI